MKIAFWTPVLVLTTCLSSFAHADNTPVVDPKLCKSLVNYQMPAGVDYQPGVDVDGKKVAPADLPGQPQMKLPTKFTIPLTVSLAKVLNLNTAQYPANQLGTSTEAQLGNFEVEGNNVSFNGQSLTDEQRDTLAALCAKAGFTK